MKVPTEIDFANDVIAEMKPDKMVRLGIQLGLSYHDLDPITSQPPFIQYMTMLNKWKAAGNKPYTWETLIEALRSRSVRELALADTLEEKYCTPI